MTARHDAAIDEARVRAIGLDLFQRVQAGGSAAPALVQWALDDEDARLQIFRLVDVLPALARDRDVVSHVREYLGGRRVPLAGLIRAALVIGRLGWPGEKVVAVAVRETVKRLARRFIAGATPDEAIHAARAARQQGQAFTLDVLGEACVSEDEADAYQRAYVELIDALGVEAARWPADPRLDEAPWGPLPRINISVKLSALYPYLDPIDPTASAAAVKARLRPILRAARAGGAHIQVDMEERQLKDLTLDIVTALFDEDEVRQSRDVGVVLQAYLRDAEADAARLIEWARRRGTPITVRLVKGAYWDYETAHARLEGWPVPVHEVKAESDASFERLTRLFLAHAGTVDLAVGSHNIRSVAHAIAVRDALALPRGQLEVQLLYGMAGSLARALTERGERVRIYMPFGELIPGMGYLVRRLLENTSNESFVRRGLAESEPPEVLLADPAGKPARAATRLGECGGPLGEPSRRRGERTWSRAPADGRSTRPVAGRGIKAWGHFWAPADGDEFRNEPHADFARAAERERVAAALAAIRPDLGGHHPLRIGGAAVKSRDELVSRDPSRPDEVVGRTGSASAEDVDRAVAAATRAFPPWRDRGAVERAAILGRAAELLRARRAELAAWIVREAGKPWREADGDVAEAVDFVEYYRREAVTLQATRRLGRLPGEVNHYLREPCGVVAVIAPWNFPLAILTGMTSAALATGNTVVMKPAEQTPVIAAKLVAVLEAAGVPHGVLNYVPGRGEVAGARLVQHADVRVIAFTGSREVGTRIYAEAARLAPGARHLKRVIAEMGGKNAVIVDEDADLDEAVQGIVTSAFSYAGQKCSACSRVIAVGGAYARLRDRLVAAARTLPMGPADHPGTVVGPLIDPDAVERVRGYIELGKRLAEPALIRDLPADLDALRGYYVPPAIFGTVPADSALARDEIFGPVLSLMRAPDFATALALATQSDYALTGGVFSRSPAHLRAARQSFRVGDLYLNRATTGARVGRQPFGGRRLSGVGYQAGGPDYLLQFIESRVITEQTLRRGFTSDELA